MANHFGKLVRVVLWNFRVRAGEHSAVKPVHVNGFKRRVKGRHFVNHAAQRPDVAFVVVRLVFPDLGTCVVRRARLSVEQSVLVGNL